MAFRKFGDAGRIGTVEIPSTSVPSQEKVVLTLEEAERLRKILKSIPEPTADLQGALTSVKGAK